MARRAATNFRIRKRVMRVSRVMGQSRLPWVFPTGKSLTLKQHSVGGKPQQRTGLAVPATPQLRDHHKIHHCKADQAGQEPLLHDTANQPPWVQHANHQLSSPKDRHLHGKGSQGKPPFRCTQTKHCQQSADATQSAGSPQKAMSTMLKTGWMRCRSPVR